MIELIIGLVVGFFVGCVVYGLIYKTLETIKIWGRLKVITDSGIDYLGNEDDIVRMGL